MGKSSETKPRSHDDTQHHPPKQLTTRLWRGPDGWEEKTKLPRGPWDLTEKVNLVFLAAGGNTSVLTLSHLSQKLS